MARCLGVFDGAVQGLSHSSVAQPFYLAITKAT